MRLPEPFFVVATQNPHEQLGTFALPESQLDRFLMRVTLGYPGCGTRARAAAGGERRELLAGIAARPRTRRLLRMQRAVRACTSRDALLDYVQAADRTHARAADLKLGLSPRAGQGLLRAAQAWAYLARRNAVLPEDVQAVLPAVVAHRLERRDAAARPGEDLAREIIESARCLRSAGGRLATAGTRRRASPLSAARAQRRGAWPRWVRRRQGMDSLPVMLQRRRLYILPTRTGVAFGALLFLMLLAGLNYANSLALFLTFLLVAFCLVVMQQCHRNLLGLSVEALHAPAVFARRPGARVPGAGESGTAGAPRPSLGRVDGETEGRADLGPGEGAMLELPVTAAARGIVRIGRMRICHRRIRSGCSAPGPGCTPTRELLVYPRPAGTLPMPGGYSPQAALQRAPRRRRR